MGKLIEFPRPLVVRAGGFTIVPIEDDVIHEQAATVREINPVAKSSTSVMQAGACQLCGHPLDGKQNASRGKDGKACTCGCHPRERIDVEMDFVENRGI